MAGCSVTEESEVGGGRFPESILSGQQREAMAEWRSSEQVENGIPSTSPPYWDIEDDEGQKPCELYGKYTWKIDKFSQINKRELRSNAFEVGGYKWYILIYPQGCDVCNHLSLFLCVANHDKLLPGWSHFAQFTIAVVNKDLKNSKYSAYDRSRSPSRSSYEREPTYIRGNEMQITRKYEYHHKFPQRLEELELEYMKDAMDLSRIRDKEEDEENFKHRENNA